MEETTAARDDLIAQDTARLLLFRGFLREAATLALSRLEISWKVGNWRDYLAATLTCPLQVYDALRHDADAQETLRQTINEVLPQDFEQLEQQEVSSLFVRLEPSLPWPAWREELLKSFTTGAHNQALFVFPNAPKIEHHGLRFRSQTEIRIYAAFLKKGILVFPLPLAVMGRPSVYREPDFLVCHQGHWGILEIHGEEFHPPETAAKEHERRRMFRELGVVTYEIYDASRCYNQPDQVVSEFLALLGRGL